MTTKKEQKKKCKSCGYNQQLKPNRKVKSKWRCSECGGTNHLRVKK